MLLSLRGNWWYQDQYIIKYGLTDKVFFMDKCVIWLKSTFFIAVVIWLVHFTLMYQAWRLHKGQHSAMKMRFWMWQASQGKFLSRSSVFLEGRCWLTAAQSGFPALGQQSLLVCPYTLQQHHYHTTPDTVPGYCGDTTSGLCSSLVSKTDGCRAEERREDTWTDEKIWSDDFLLAFIQYQAAIKRVIIVQNISRYTSKRQNLTLD